MKNIWEPLLLQFLSHGFQYHTCFSAQAPTEMFEEYWSKRLASLKSKPDITFSVFLLLDQNLMKLDKDHNIQVSNNSQNIFSLFLSQIYQPKIKCKDRGSYFYKNQKYRPLEIEKTFFFNYFIPENPNFSYMHFFRKCSMIRWNIPLKACHHYGIR